MYVYVLCDVFVAALVLDREKKMCNRSEMKMK